MRNILICFLLSLLTLAFFSRCASDPSSSPSSRSSGDYTSALDNLEAAEEAEKNQRYEEAIELYGKVADRIRGERRLKDEYAFTLTKIGDIYHDTGRYEQAIRYFQEAMEIREELNDRHEVADNLIAIGLAYRHWGRFEEALEHYEKVLSIREEIDDKIGTASVLNNIGVVYLNWGRYDRAVESFERSLSICTTAGDEQVQARLLNNIGLVYNSWGRYEQATEYYKRALVMNEKLGREYGIATCLNNIGTVLHTQAQHRAAIAHFERALVVAEQMNRKESMATALNNIAGVYSSWGQYEKAIDYYQLALTHVEQLGRRDKTAVYLHNIGNMHHELEQNGKSKEYYERALTINEDLGAEAGIALNLSCLGFLYLNWDRYDDAILCFTRSLEIKERLRLTAQGEVRRDYLASQIHTYRGLASAYVHAGKPALALEASEQGKARYLYEKIGERIGDSTIHVPGVERIREGLPEDQAILMYANIDWKKPIVLLVTREKILALKTDKSSFTRNVGATCRMEMDSHGDASRGVDIENPDVEIEEDSFARIVAYYRYLLTKPDPTQAENAQLSFVSQNLYNLLIEPIAQEIAGKEKLLILPDGVLGFIPFETLVDENGRYLVEDYTIGYAQSLAVSELIVRRRHGEGKKALAAFGGAEYEATPCSGSPGLIGEPRSVTSREAEYAVSRGGQEISDLYERMGLRWANLPGTLEEVEGIERLFPGSTIYIGADVNEALVKRLSARGQLKDYSVLHFSTHGLVVPEYPELSALVLSQGTGGEEDGYLCMSEIAALDLEAEFVNLSACETGLGRIYAGEGIVGLTQSFLIAGARGLSVSLWQVADVSTKDFMLGMYRLVKEEGLSYPDAIRRMKIEFLRGTGANTPAGAYTSPYYWAPFVYYGGN